MYRPICLSTLLGLLSFAPGLTGCSDMQPGVESSFGGASALDLELCDEVIAPTVGQPRCAGTDLSWTLTEYRGDLSWQQARSYAGRELNVLGRLSSSSVEHQFLLEIDRQEESGYELVYRDLSPAQVARDASSAYYWSFPVARPGQFQYRMIAVVAGSCSSDGEFDRESCQELARTGYDPMVSTNPPVAHESLEIAAGCSSETTLAGDCEHHDYAAAVPRPYAFDDMRLCRSRPTSNSPCLERDPSTIQKGERFWIQLRLSSVTRHPILRISLTNPGQTFGELFDAAVISQFELPENEAYGNAVNGWQYVWGAMQLYIDDLGTDPAGNPLQTRQFDLIPKIFDTQTGLTHFESPETLRITVRD